MMQMSEISGDAAKHEITATHIAMHYCYAYCYALLLCNKKAMLN